MAPRKNVLGIRDVEADNEDETKKSHTQWTSVKIRSGSSGVKRTYSRAILSEEQQKKKEDDRIARAEERARKRKKIVVSVDFGTTNSGIAYVSSSKTARDVSLITQWTGGQFDLLEKCPTRIHFPGPGDTSSEILFGYDVEAGMECCQWFKLLLDESTEPTEFDDPLLRQAMGHGLLRLPQGKTAIDVTADFLSCLYKHIIQFLRRMIGSEAVNQTPILFSLSLPATWSPTAREATREAAERAGFVNRDHDEIVLVDEPECAAIATLKTTIANFDDNHTFQPGSCCIVIDLGGGTADLVSYKIVKLVPLQLDEACVGEGAKVGGTTIDRNLHQLLGKRFGHAFTQLPLGKIASGSDFMNAFEGIKRDFKGRHKGEKVHLLPLKMQKLDNLDETLAQVYDFEEDRVKISSEDLEAMFDPVLVSTFELLRRQIKRIKKAKMPTASTIVLCGGLGSSPYINHRLSEFTKSEIGDSVRLITPERPWSAIARGGAMRCLDEKPPVLFRRARDNIGITVRKKFEDGVHKEEDLYICPLLGRRAKDQMQWLVQRGDKLTPNMKKRLNTYVVIDKREFDQANLVYQDLYKCTSNTPPGRLQAPVHKFGQIKMNLTAIVTEQRKKFSNDKGSRKGQKIDIDISIFVTMASDKGILDVTAKVGPRLVGETKIEYIADPAWKGNFIAN